MLKENIRNSYLTAFETVKNFVENDENIERTTKIYSNMDLILFNLMKNILRNQKRK